MSLRALGGAGDVCPFPYTRQIHQLTLSIDGMFAILVPATILPLIITLLWAERKAKRLGLVPVPEQTSFVTKVKRFISELDVFGLLLLGTAVALILLPITLSRTAKGGWNNRMFLSSLARF